MQSFNDTTGRAWPVSITVGTLKRIRTVIGIDLTRPLEPPDNPAMVRLDNDVIALVDSLWIACVETAAERNVSEEQFAELLGEDLGAAREALWGSLSDFFRHLGRVETVASIQRILRVTTEANQRAAARIDSRETEQKITSILGRSFGNAPESSA